MLLKRADERHVTMRAYENPAFVEDLTRKATRALFAVPGVKRFALEASNEESIHTHDSIARIRHPRGAHLFELQAYANRPGISTPWPTYSQKAFPPRPCDTPCSTDTPSTPPKPSDDSSACSSSLPKFGSGFEMVSELRNSAWRLATGLIHLPREAAGVWKVGALSRHRADSPAAQGGRGLMGLGGFV